MFKKNGKIVSSVFIVSLILFFVSCQTAGKVNYSKPSKVPVDPGVSINAPGSGVMLQGYNWNSTKEALGGWYDVILSKSNDIKDTYEYVWFPPPTDSVDQQGYLPRRLNSLNSAYGDVGTLKQAIAAIKPAKALADVVINHRCGSTSWGDFTDPSFGTIKGQNYEAIASNDEGFTSSKTDPMNGNSSRGGADSGESYAAGRDLDHENAIVQKEIVEWMNNVLKEVGFVGFRYDFVKGFDGKYIGYYNRNADIEFSVGEYWPTLGFSSISPSTWNNKIYNWIEQTGSSYKGYGDSKAETGFQSHAFDFSLKGIINSVFGNKTYDAVNKNYYLLASEDTLMHKAPEWAVTFVDNHDTGSTQGHWFVDSVDVGNAYAFILTHPGMPCVAWQHYFSGNGSQYLGDTIVPGTSLTYRQHIDYLINLRKAVGIEFDSPIEILEASDNCYAARISGKQEGSGELVVVIGDGYTPTMEGYVGVKPVYYGSDFRIWRK